MVKAHPVDSPVYPLLIHSQVNFTASNQRQRQYADVLKNVSSLWASLPALRKMSFSPALWATVDMISCFENLIKSHFHCSENQQNKQTQSSRRAYPHVHPLFLWYVSMNLQLKTPACDPAIPLLGAYAKKMRTPGPYDNKNACLHLGLCAGLQPVPLGSSCALQISLCETKPPKNHIKIHLCFGTRVSCCLYHLQARK